MRPTLIICWVTIAVLALFTITANGDLIIEWNVNGFRNAQGNSSFFCPFTSSLKEFIPLVPAQYYFCGTMNQGEKIRWVFNDDVNHTLVATGIKWEKMASSINGEALPQGLMGNVTFPGNSTTAPYTEYEVPFAGSFYFRDGLWVRYMYAWINVTSVDSSSSDDFTDGEVVYGDILSWLTLILLWLSIAGALLTILTFTIHSDIRTYPIKLIMYLCVCIVFSNFFFLMAFEPAFLANDVLCYLTGMTIHGFFLANFCWTFCIAFNFYQMIVKRNRESESLEKWYHLFSWGFPIFCVEFVSGFLYYGDIGGVCYVKNYFFVFFFFFLPGLVIISANAILFFFVAREIHETLASAPKTDKREKRKEFRVYISIFISIGLSWIFGFLMVLFEEVVIRYIFLTLFSVFTPLQGALIFASYCINAKVFGKWAGLIGKCIPLFRRWENLDTRRTTSSGGRTHTSRSSSRMASSSASADPSSTDASSTAD